MKAGNLISRVKFYAKVISRDDYGSSIDTYPIATITTRGEIRYSGGSKTITNDERQYTKSMILTVRYRSDIVETMRVQIDGENDLFEIDGVPEVIGRKVALRMTLIKLSDGLSEILIDPPTDFLAALDFDHIDLTWINNDDDNAIAIERSIDGNNFEQINRTIPGVESFIDNNIEDGNKYFYRIRAFKYHDYSVYTSVEVVEYSFESYLKTISLFISDGTTEGSELVNSVGDNATLTDNLITNPTMEYDFNPFDNLGTAPTTNERSAAYKHSGTYSRKIILNSVGQTGIKTKVFPTKVGETITFSFWFADGGGTGTPKFVIRKGDSSGYEIPQGNVTIFTGQWRETSGSFVVTGAGPDAYLAIYLDSGTRTFYVDDIVFSTDAGNVAVIMPASVEMAAIDTSNIFYHSSGNAMTVRIRPYENFEGYNKSIFNYPGGNIIICNDVLSNDDYCKMITYLDYGEKFYDNIENEVFVGSGKDYETIPLALAGITDANYLNRYKLTIYDDVTLTELVEYAETYGSYHWYFAMKDFTYINGNNKRLVCSIPDGSTSDQKTYYEPCAVKAYAGMRDFFISAYNLRYCVHIDDASGANRKQELFNTELSHLGHSEGTGGTPFGTGTRTGEEMVLKDCTLKGINVVAWHTNVSFSKIAKLTLFNCTINALNGVGVRIDSLTSRLNNLVNIYKGSNNGNITYMAEYYEPTATNLYILNDAIISKYDNNSSFNNIAINGGSLKIISTTAGSIDSVAGTGATALTSSICDYEDNYAIGRLEVGEWSYNANVKMGVRLGDCSSVNKEMTLNVDGVPKTITFNENFTAQTNAQVLEFINTALAGSAIVSLYQRASENELIELE